MIQIIISVLKTVSYYTFITGTLVWGAYYGINKISDYSETTEIPELIDTLVINEPVKTLSLKDSIVTYFHNEFLDFEERFAGDSLGCDSHNNAVMLLTVGKKFFDLDTVGSEIVADSIVSSDVLFAHREHFISLRLLNRVKQDFLDAEDRYKSGLKVKKELYSGFRGEEEFEKHYMYYLAKAELKLAEVEREWARYKETHSNVPEKVREISIKFKDGWVVQHYTNLDYSHIKYKQDGQK